MAWPATATVTLPQCKACPDRLPRQMLLTHTDSHGPYAQRRGRARAEPADHTPGTMDAAHVYVDVPGGQQPAVSSLQAQNPRTWTLPQQLSVFRAPGLGTTQHCSACHVLLRWQT